VADGNTVGGDVELVPFGRQRLDASLPHRAVGGGSFTAQLDVSWAGEEEQLAAARHRPANRSTTGAKARSRHVRPSGAPEVITPKRKGRLMAPHTSRRRRDSLLQCSMTLLQ
jgi:hypothetical protein